MEVTVEGVSEALDILCEHPGEVLSLLDDTNSPLASSVSRVVRPKIKETRTTGSDLKGKRTRVSDEPDGSTSQSPLRRSNYGRTHDITNHHVASSSRPCNPKKKYTLDEQQNLILAVAIHGRKWQEIKEMLKGTERSDENWKEKWRDMMRNARNNMDKNQKWLHIVAAVVQFKDEKHSKFKQEFQKWFEKMGNEDREKMASAKEWLNNLKAEMFIPTDINHARLRWGHIFQKKFKK